MRILPDGTVEIRNKRTGETKIVQPNELPNFGIPYSKFKTELDAFRATGNKTDIPTIIIMLTFIKTIFFMFINTFSVIFFK